MKYPGERSRSTSQPDTRYPQSTMPDPCRVLITANPFSGKGTNEQRVQRLRDQLAKHNLKSDLIWDLDERRKLLSNPDIGQTYRCLIAAGGDGSIAAAISDLALGGAPARLPLAMLPIGNENLFAIEMGFDQGEAELARTIAQGHTRCIDVGKANGQLFTLMTSVGFDSEVVQRIDRWRRSGKAKLKRVSRASYAPKIIGAIAQYKYPPITLHADGQTHTGVHVFVFNIGQYGGSLGLAKHADPVDGLLDWIVFKRPGLIGLANYGVSILRGKHLQRDDVAHGRSSHVTITTQDPLPIQIDGDPGGQTPVEVSVLPQALCVITQA